jgi:hypothetical protein
MSLLSTVVARSSNKDAVLEGRRCSGFPLVARHEGDVLLFRFLQNFFRLDTLDSQQMISIHRNDYIVKRFRRRDTHSISQDCLQVEWNGVVVA